MFRRRAAAGESLSLRRGQRQRSPFDVAVKVSRNSGVALIIEHVLDIGAPPALVWEVLTDLPRYSEWNPFVIACRSTLVPGESIDLRVKLRDKPQDQREWMVEFVAGKRFAYRMKPMPLGALSSRRSHEIEALAGGRTRYRSHMQLAGWLMPLVRTLLGANLQRGFRDMSEAVRTRAEQLAAERPHAGG